MRCVIWAAVSSRPQAAPEKDSLPSQIDAARQEIARHDSWHEVAEPLIIPGHTRSYLFLADAAQDVPVYSELMSLARTGRIDLLICRSHDRLGRTDALVSQVEGYLRHHGVQVLSLDMPQQVIEPDQYEGRLDRASIWTSAIGRARAEDEMAELRRRHRFGMRARVRSGKHPGKAPLGYEKTKEGLIIKEPEAEIVRLAFRWFCQGLAPRAIAERLSREAPLPSPITDTGIRYILRNPTYCGSVSYGRTDGHGHLRSDCLLADGQHEPIISRQEWEAAQAEYERRGRDRRSPYTRYPLSGQVVCGYCGGSMKIHVTTNGAREYRYYICGAEGCRRNAINAVALEDLVAGWIYRSCQRDELAATIQELSERTNDHEEDRKRLGAAQVRIEQALDRYAEDYEYGLLARHEFYSHKARLEDQSAALADELAALEEKRVDPEQITSALDSLLSLTDAEHANRWRDQGNVATVKMALRQAGIHITIKDAHADIPLDFA